MGEEEVQERRDESEAPEELVHILLVKYLPATKENQEVLMKTLEEGGLEASPIMFSPLIPNTALGHTVKMALGITPFGSTEEATDA